MMPIKRGSDTFLVTIKDCLDQSFDPVRLVASSHQSFISLAFDSSRKLSHCLYQSNHGSTARSKPSTFSTGFQSSFAASSPYYRS